MKDIEEIFSDISDKKTKDAIENPEFLTELKFWVHRIKFDTPLKYIFFVIIGIIIILNSIVYSEIGYLNTSLVYGDIFTIFVIILGLFCTTYIPKSFQRLIYDNKRMFYLEKPYNYYVPFVIKTFKSKKEFYYPLIFALIYAFAFIFAYGILRNFAYTEASGVYIYISDEGRILWVFHILLSAFLFFLLFLMLLSSLLMILFVFKCMNVLGTEEFPLNITYKEIKTGSFDEIGKYLISLVTPILILSIILGIIGLINIIVFLDYVSGIIYMSLSFLILFLLFYLLLRNTIHIKDFTSKFKSDLKNSMLSYVQIILSWPEEEIDYHKIDRIRSFIKEIENIRNRPYKRATIRKLLITIFSSFSPVIFSLIRLGLGI